MAETGGKTPEYVTAYAAAGDIVMPYLRFGRGERDLVILPGLSLRPVTGSAAAVAAAYKGFAEDFRVTLFDRRTNAGPGYSLRDMARDTARIMDTLGIKCASVFGASQGGVIAQFLAIEHPEKVGRLILGSTYARSNPMMDAVVAEWIRLADEGRKEELVRSTYEAILSEKTRERLLDRLVRLFGTLSDEDLGRYRVFVRAGMGLSTYDDLDRIACPALVLGAEGDRVTGPEASRELAERLGAELYLYDASYGHDVYDEAPDYKERIRAFLGN